MVNLMEEPLEDEIGSDIRAKYTHLVVGLTQIDLEMVRTGRAPDEGFHILVVTIRAGFLLKRLAV